jgi:hypothetical protein
MRVVRILCTYFSSFVSFTHFYQKKLKAWKLEHLQQPPGKPVIFSEPPKTIALPEYKK